VASTVVTIDLSALPSALAAMGGNQVLALMTADGVTWQAEFTIAVPPFADPTPQAAFARLMASVSGVAATEAQAATARAQAIAAAASAVPAGAGSIKP